MYRLIIVAAVAASTAVACDSQAAARSPPSEGLMPVNVQNEKPARNAKTSKQREAQPVKRASGGKLEEHERIRRPPPRIHVDIVPLADIGEADIRQEYAGSKARN